MKHEIKTGIALIFRKIVIVMALSLTVLIILMFDCLTEMSASRFYQSVPIPFKAVVNWVPPI